MSSRKPKWVRTPGSWGWKPPKGSPNANRFPQLVCKFVGTVQPYGSINLALPVRPNLAFSGGNNEFQITGGGVVTQPVTQFMPSGGATPFGVERFEVQAEEENGATALAAGSHPFSLTTTLELNQAYGILPVAPELLRNLDTVLPPGLIGNPLAVPQCSNADFATLREANVNACAPETAVGVAIVTYNEPQIAHWKTQPVPIFNLEPAPGEPARFGFSFAGVPVAIDTSVLTGNGYAVQAEVKNASQAAEVLGSTVVIWGVPGAPVHDNARGWECLAGGATTSGNNHPLKCTHLENQHAKPYLSMPTYCSKALVSSLTVQDWEKGAPVLGPYYAQQPALVGCNSLPFEPTLRVAPDQRTTSTPTGMTVEVKIPQETTLAANGLAEADAFSTELEFPEGLQANAGSADGLETCSAGGVGFEGSDGETGGQLESTIERQRFTAGPAFCPDASKIGEVDVHSPLLEHDLKGSAYLAAQNTSPFASPLVLYFLAEDPISGVRLKLAGETRILPNGQLIGVFKNTPPLPAETITLHLYNGPRATLATPPYCRAYTSRARFQTWSGQNVERTSSFTPEATPSGAPCQAGGPLPFAPKLTAGSVNNHAGAYSAFTLTIERPDGQAGTHRHQHDPAPGPGGKTGLGHALSGTARTKSNGRAGRKAKSAWHTRARGSAPTP